MKASMFIAIAALSLASCTDYLTPEGEVVEREIEIPQSINEIEIGDGMTLILSDDVPAGKAVIRTHGNIQPYIKAEIRGDEVIFTVDAHRFKDLEVTVSASLVQYNDFTASGGSAISYDGSPAILNVNNTGGQTTPRN